MLGKNYLINGSNKNRTGWWFGTFFIFHNTWDVILPNDDSSYFSEG
jgi:hypothetical protein